MWTVAIFKAEGNAKTGTRFVQLSSVVYPTRASAAKNIPTRRLYVQRDSKSSSYNVTVS